MRFRPLWLVEQCAFSLVGLGASANAQSGANAVNDVVIPPGANSDQSMVRLLWPAGVPTVRAVLVLTPGSNGDGPDAASDTVG